MMKRIVLMAAGLVLAGGMAAQRATDLLERGVVAVPAQGSAGLLVGWRMMGEEYYDVTYNLYRDGRKIAEGLTVSNYVDAGGTTTSRYQVAAVVRGVEQELSKAATPWTTDDGNGNKYLSVKVKPIIDRAGKDATGDYQLNDVSLADLDGDGRAEMIVKRPCGVTTDVNQSARFHVLDCYDLDGNRLWWIDLGPNMQAEADEQWDAVAYDWDGDGRAEVLMRGADNMIIHHADGSVTNIGSMTTDHRRNGGLPYCSVGNEYLLYLDGATAKPFQIGPASHPDYMTYPLERGLDSDWGTGIVGHRSTKHFFGAPFLDGRKASIFLGRGIYTKELMAAYDVDPQTHQLTQRWRWECTVGGAWFGQGYHNYAIADVDWDGRDEIVYGSMVIDDNGKGLSTTGLGHGDAQHCSDLDPYRHGQEQFACNESSPNMNYRNATTGEMYFRSVGTGDDGRALAGNFSNSYPGCTGRSTNVGMVSCVADKVITELGDLIAWSDLNFRIYWDGDLQEEIVNSPGTERDCVVIKPGQGRIFQSGGVKMCNWSKNNPCATGDIIGDWREELILRSGDNTELRIYTTPYYTKYRNYTLWHDHQYRQGMVWECLGYNQPPHASYFLGEMEGITMAPPPLTMTGRVEVENGGVIKNEDKHFIVCEPNDTRVTIADGATPYILTFNVPSWVQGTAKSNSTSKEARIDRTVFTCTVDGGALGNGQTRIVKQGDGVLVLPKVDMQHAGETNVWAGTLCFDGTMHNSDVRLGRFAQLNSAGTFKNIKAEYAAVVRPGGEGKIGTVCADERITLGFGSIVELDLDGETHDCDKIKADVIDATDRKTGDVWVNYGPKYLRPVIRVVSDNLTAGDYVIGECATFKGSLTNLLIEGTGTFKVALSYSDGRLILSLGDTRGPATIAWTGAKGSAWDFASTENFIIDGDESMTPETFIMGDEVTFGDNATTFDVSIDADINASVVLVCNDTKAYTFSGTGKIAGGAFVKEGKGRVTINTDNTYTGGNRLSGGTTIVKSLSNDVLAHGNLGGVTTSASMFVMENGAELQSTAAVTNGSPISFATTDGGVINNSADFVQQKPFSGTLLAKRGNGWLKTQASGSALQRMVIKAGTVENRSDMAAKVVEFQGGALVDNNGTSNELNIGEGNKGTWTTANRQTYSNSITGAGTLTVKCAAEQGNGWVATRTPLSLNLSRFEGTITAGATIAADGRFTLNTANGNNIWTLNIPDGVTVQNSGKTLKIGAVTGTGNLGGYSSFSNNGTSSANTWAVGGDENFKFDGKVIASDNFTKTGASKMNTTSAWETTGTITVSAGELHVGANASLGTGSLTVSKGATLSGTGKLNNSAYTINGTLQVGTLSTAVSGTLDMGGKNVSIPASGTYLVGVRKCATANNNGCASIVNVNRLTINGTIELFLGTTSDFAPGDSIRIFSAKTLAGTPKFNLPAEYIWDTSRISEGLIFVTAISDAVATIPLDPTRSHTIYTLGGRQIQSPLHTLAPGIYIIDGKKRVIR